MKLNNNDGRIQEDQNHNLCTRKQTRSSKLNTLSKHCEGWGFKEDDVDIWT